MAEPFVRAAAPGDRDAVAAIIYESSDGWYDRWTGGRRQGLAVICAWFDRGGAALSREVLKVAELDGRVAGVLASYPAGQGTRRAGRSLRIALRQLPPWRWRLAMRIFGHGARRTSRAHRPTWYVDVLATAAGMRRRGVARALMRAAEEDARRAGMAVMALETDTGNDAALALYGGLGFEVVGTHPPDPPRPALLSLLKHLRPGGP